jgi:dTMP kinase
MIKNPYPGKLITIDGLDGSGKSMQAGLLKSFLEKNGKDVYLTHYPTEKSIYSTEIQRALKKEINLDSYQLHTLFAKDREEDFFNYVIPALKDSFYVVSDRYVFSSLAVGPKDISELEQYEELNKDFFVPDLGIIIVVKPETSLQRIIDRGEKIETYESLERLKIAYDGYMDILKKYDYLKLVDGEQSIEKIHEDIKALVKEYLLK